MAARGGGGQRAGRQKRSSRGMERWRWRRRWAAAGRQLGGWAAAAGRHASESSGKTTELNLALLRKSADAAAAARRGGPCDFADHYQPSHSGFCMHLSARLLPFQAQSSPETAGLTGLFSEGVEPASSCAGSCATITGAHKKGNASAAQPVTCALGPAPFQLQACGPSQARPATRGGLRGGGMRNAGAAATATRLSH